MKNKVKILTMLLAALLAVGLLLATACTNPTNGEPGAPGKDGTPGTPGTDGTDGTDGEDGEPGIGGSPGSGAGGAPSVGGIVTFTSGSVSPSDMDALFARSDVSTVMLMGAGLNGSAGDSTYVVPATKTLSVIGALDLNSPAADYVINAYDGNFDISGNLTNTTATDILILNATDKGKITSSQLGSAVAPLLVPSIPASGTPAATEPVMIQSLSISSEADLETYTASERLYVLGDLATTGAAAFSAAKVTVFGSTIAGGDITLTSGTVLQGELKANAATVAVVGLENFKGVLNTNANTVTAAATAVELAELKGTGTLTLSGAIVDVAIGDGDGKINVTGTPDFGSATDDIVFGNKGLTTFATAVTGATESIAFAGPVSFVDALTVGTGGATFGGDVEFTTDTTSTVTIGGATTFKEATFGAGVTVTPTAAVTFEGNASFAEALTTGADTVDFEQAASFDDALITATGAVTFKGVSTFAALTTDSGAVTFENTSTAEFTGLVTTGGAVNFNGLTTTFADDLTITAVGVSFGGDAFFVDDHEISGDYAFTLVNSKSLGVINGSSQIPILTGGVGNATITPSSSGVLAFTDDGKITQSAGAIEIGGLALLADGASYEVIENLALTIAVSSSLTLGDAAALILDHDGSDAAALKGTGELIAGGTKIVGGTGGWEAGSSSGALSIIISPDSIKGTTVNASLAGAGSGAGIEVVATGNLALVENIKIDLSTEGTITIREGGVITLSAASSSIIATNTSNASGNGTTITNITPSGDIGYSSTEAGANDTLESINTSSTGTLTGTTGDATIAKTTTVS